MQTYDMLMLVVLVGATVFGFWKGMAWQIASLASLVVSYFASLQVCRATGAAVWAAGADGTSLSRCLRFTSARRSSFG